MQDDGRVIRMGAIGIGGGALAMVPIFAKHPRFRWTAGADIDPDVLAAFGRDFDAETYSDAMALCQSPNVDAVYIASPNQYHCEQALAAIQNGKHVLCEKPMSINLEDADRMIEAADRAGVQLAVNVKHSFERRVLKLREMVTSGRYGRLRMINYWMYSDWIYRPRTPEELNPEWGGGVPWRQGPHQLDIIRTIAGGVARSVRGMTGIWDLSRPVAGVHSAFVDFEDGTVATAVYSGYDHFNSAPLVTGMGSDGPRIDPSRYARGRKQLRATTPEMELETKRQARYGGTLGRNAPRAGGGEGGMSGGWVSGGPLLVSFDRADVWVTPSGLLVSGDDEQEEIPVPGNHGDALWGRVQSFYDAIINNHTPAADGRWGKATLELILGLIQSSQERREIPLRYQVPTADAALSSLLTT